MSFRLVPKSVTLNDLERRNGRYIALVIEFGKPVFQYITASICGGIYARVYCILYCVYDVVVKKVHVRYFISGFLLAAIVRPSVVCNVRACALLRGIEIFGNVSTPFGTLAICALSVKILRRSSQGNASVGEC